MGVQGSLGLWKVLLCRISLDEGMLGPMGVEHRSRRSPSSDLMVSCVVLSSLHGPNLMFYEAIRLGK